jgi:hypothetical protein
VSPGGPHKNNLGAMFSYDGNDTYLFFDYFMSWTSHYLVDLGFTEAIPFRDYKVRFPIGIMGSGPNEYCFQAAAQFKWKAGPPGTDTFYPDFKTMFTNTVPGANPADCGTAAMTTFLSKIENGLSGPNAMLGIQTSATYYFANLQPALAAAVDSGVVGGRTAWDRAQASGQHPTDAYNNVPIFAVIPRALSTTSVNVSITANPPTVKPGGGSTLSWTTSNAESCIASGGWAGNKPTSGSESVSGLQANQSYVLTCSSNSAGTQASTAVVTVLASAPTLQPTVSLSASANVQSGQKLTLTWTSTDATSCVASGGWNGNKPVRGTETVGPLSSSTSFSLACSGTGGMHVATTNVTLVTATAPGPSADPPKKKGGGGAMDLGTLLMLLGALVGRRMSARARLQ